MVLSVIIARKKQKFLSDASLLLDKAPTRGIYTRKTSMVKQNDSLVLS
jgi:hypothetical protein